MISENTTGDIKDKLSMPELILLLLSTLAVMAGATLAPALPALQANFADSLNDDQILQIENN